MRFQIEQRFRAPLDDVWALYADATIYPHLVGMSRVDPPELLDRTEGPDGDVTVRVRYRFVADLPSAARRVIDADKLTWVEATVYDAATRRATAQLLPDNYADRMTASADATFASEAGATMRRVTGEVRVRMPLVGGKVEGAIVSGLQEYFDEEREIAARLLGD